MTQPQVWALVVVDVVVTSTTLGILRCSVENELTYYAEGSPLVANATIEISNALLPGMPSYFD